MKETPWYEDDAYWDTMRVLVDDESKWSAAPGEVDKIVGLVGIEPGSRVLDLGCGMGRHSLELARRGFRVTGVDRTVGYLEEAKKRARDEGLDIDFVCEDMRGFARPESFDAAVNLFTSFGYFEEDDNRKVLSNVYESLRPGGTFLLDLMGKEILARVYRERVWHEHDGILVLEEPKIRDNWSRVENRWIVLDGDQRREVRFSLRIYSAVELCGLLAEVGFGVRDVCGGLDGIPYDHRAERLIVISER